MRPTRVLGFLAVALLAAAAIWAVSRRREDHAPDGSTPQGAQRAKQAGAPQAARDSKPKDEAPAPSVTLRGRAVERSGETIVPVTGAVASCSSISMRTQGDGRFELRELPSEEKLRLEIDAAEHALEMIQLGAEVEPSPVRDIGDIILQPSHVLQVAVLDEDDHPVEDAVVTAEPRSQRGGGELSTAGSWEEVERPVPRLGAGIHEGARLPPGECRVHADAPGLNAESVTVFLPADGRVTIRLQPSKRLSGRVIDGASRPLSGAVVHVGGSAWDVDRITDATGGFTFDEIEYDRVSVSATAEGYAAVKTDTDLPRQDVELILFREAVIEGTVVDGKTRAPLAGVTVRLESDGGETSFPEDHTGADGRFVLRKAPPGAHRIALSSPTHLPDSAGPFTVEEGSRLEGLVLEMEEGLRQRGRVVDLPSLRPVKDCRIRIDGTGSIGGWHPNPKWDEGHTGGFEITGLLEGDYRIQVESRQHVDVDINRHLPLGGGEDLVIELQPGASIEGVVLDADGQPAPGAEVRCELPDSERSAAADVVERQVRRQTATTDRLGRYAICAVPAFDRFVVAATRNDLPMTWRPDVACEAGLPTRGIDLRFGRGAAVSGRVVDGRGRPVPRALIVANPSLEGGPPLPFNDSLQHGESADSAGRFTLRGLNAGRWRFEASTQALGSSRAVEIELEDGKRESVTLEFEPGAVLSGTVVDSRGSPVVGALVWATVEDAGVLDASTDVAGAFALRVARAGVAGIVVEAAGHLDRKLALEVPAEGVRIQLEPTVPLEGQLVARGPQRIVPGTIWFEEEDGDVATRAYTDALGRFRAALRPGRWRLLVDVGGFAEQRVEVDVDASYTPPVRIQLEPGGDLTVVARSAALDEPVTVQWVLVFPADGTQGAGQPFPQWSGEGSTSLEQVRAGLVALAVFASGYRPLRLDGVEIHAGKDNEVVARMERSTGITGHVHAAGRCLDGVPVVARSVATGAEARATSAFAGAFELPQLIQGHYELRVGPAPGLKRGRVATLAVQVDEKHGVHENIDLSGVTVEGRLRKGGKPLEDFEVGVESEPNVMTLPGGRFSLRVPGAGQYVLEIRDATTEDLTVVRRLLVVPDGVRSFSYDVDL